MLSKTKVKYGSQNERKCLLNATEALLPQGEKKIMQYMMEKLMPSEGNHSPSEITPTLATHGLDLKRVIRQCTWKGGAEVAAAGKLSCRPRSTCR